MNLIGYTRVSTEEQAEDGFGLDAQWVQLQAHATAQGWGLERISDEGYSAGSMRRPGLERALAMCDAGEVDGIVVAKLDRLSRSVVDFGQMMAQARKKGWRIIALDMGVDTGTTTGKLVANLLMTVAEWERDIIAQRTREGMAEARRQGAAIGAKPCDAKVAARVIALRASGLSYRAVADALEAEGVPTPQGGKRWYASSVRSVCVSAPA